MSLLAATLIVSTAMAAEESTYEGPTGINFSGDAKLFYSTNDSMDTGYTTDPDGSLFRQNNSAGQAAVGLGLDANLTQNVQAGAHLTALTSLGLYNNIVANVWEGTPEDEFWFDQVWLAGTMGNTLGKIGRMELDTPLVFSEKWSIAANTFEAALLVNTDIPGTTVYGAYIGQSNGSGTASGFAGVTNDFNGTKNTNFESFYGGAYALGAVNNSWEPLTVQAWYYQAQHLLAAYWLEANLKMSGFELGGQFTGVDYSAAGANTYLGTALTEDSGNTAFAAKLGYSMDKKFAVSGAFSQTAKDDKNGLGAGGNLDGYGQSKLYTEAWWNYGYITQSDTTAYNITATTAKELTWAQLGLYFTQAKTKDGFTGVNGVEDALMTEVTLEAAQSFGPVDVGVYYIYTKADDQNQEKAKKKGDASNTVQAYLTYAF